MKRWLLAAALVILPARLMAQTVETLNPGQPFSVQADHTDATDPTTGRLVPVDGYRLRQNGTVAFTLPFSARDAQGRVTFAFPRGWPAGVYDILVTAYNVINRVTNEAPLPGSTANIRLTVGTQPPPPPPPSTPPPPSPPPPGQGCGWAISPSTLTVPAAGGSFNGSLTAATTCAWTVYSTSAWLTVGSTVKGTGPRTIPFSVTANTATAGRAGNVIVVDGATGSMATNIAIHQVAGGDAPPPPPSPPTQCADGLDNDKDGLIDLADPGCANATDNDESNPPPPPLPRHVERADHPQRTVVRVAEGWR